MSENNVKMYNQERGLFLSKFVVGLDRNVEERVNVVLYISILAECISREDCEV
jgi:hypothetical protein